MDKKWFQNPWSNCVPAIMVLIFLAFYAFSQWLLIECPNRNICEQVSPERIFTSPTEQNGPVVSKAAGWTKEAENKKAAPSPKMILAQKYRDRFIWQFLILTQALFSFLATFIFLFIFRQSTNSLYCLAAFTISALLGFGLAFFDSMPIAERILSNTIAQGEGGLAGVITIMRLSNAIAYTTLFSAVFAVCGLLSRKPANESSAAEKLALAAANLQTLRTMLYVCTVLLVVAVLRMTAINNLSLSFLPADSVEPAMTFYSGLISILGGFFTLLLAGIFLPSMFILQQRAKELLKISGFVPAAQEEKLKSAGFAFSMTDSLPRILAVVAPLLTGQIADLLGKFPTPFSN